MSVSILLLLGNLPILHRKIHGIHNCTIYPDIVLGRFWVASTLPEEDVGPTWCEG